MSKINFPDIDSVSELDEEHLIEIFRLAEIGLSHAAIVHEARQPLSALKMALQILMESKDRVQNAKEYLDKAVEQVNRLERLMEPGRDLLCGDSNEKADVDLGELVAGVLSVLSESFKRGKVDLVSDFRVGLPLIEVEKTKIDHLFFNLISNALDAVRDKEDGRIVVSVRRSSGDSVEAIVADNGYGIAPEISDKIYQPFFTTKSKDKGTGLGLFISRRIAVQQGAQIELLDESAVSALDWGPLATAFRIVFPARRDMASDKATILPPAAMRQILLVDDEEVIRTLLVKVLELEDLDCLGVADGEEALSMLEAGFFDLLVVDKNMPGISGLDVAKAARKINPVMPILMITAYASEMSAREAAAIGVSDYLTKPLDIEQFKKRVLALLKIKWDKDKSSGRKYGVRSRFGVSAVSPSSGGAASESPDSASVSLEGVCVLIVEPDGDTRDKLAGIIERQGCSVVAFASAKEAESRVRRMTFDIIVAARDVFVERTDWLDTPAGGRARESIVIMDRGGVDMAIETIHIGARGMLTPPFNESKVTAELRRAMKYLFDDRENL